MSDNPLEYENPLMGGGTLPLVPAPASAELLEARIYGALLNPREDMTPAEQMDKIESDVVLTGSSEELNLLMAQETQARVAANTAALKDMSLDPDVSTEDLTKAANGVKIASEAPISLATIYADKLATRDDSTTHVEAEVQDAVAPVVDQIVANEQAAALEEVFDPYRNQDELQSPLGWGVDVVASVLPLNWQSNIMAMREAVGLESNMWDLVFYGSAGDDLKRFMKELPPERQAEAMGELKKVIDKSGYTGTNAFIGHMLTQEFIENPHTSDAQSVMENIIGVLDVAWLGGIARGAFRAIAGRVGTAGVQDAPAVLVRTKTSEGVREALGIKSLADETEARVLPHVQHGHPLNITNRVSQSQSKKDAASIIADETGKNAERLNIGRNDVITDWGLPKVYTNDNVPVTAYPADVAAEVTRVRTIIDNTLDDIDPHVLINYTEEELTKAGLAASEKLGSILGSKLNVPTSKIKITDTGVEFHSMYQASDVGGWTSLKRLQGFIETTFAKNAGQLKDLRVLKKNVETGQWKDVSNQLGLKQNQGKGEYSFSTSFRMDADPTMKEAFGIDSIYAPMGRFTKYLTSPLGMFPTKTTQGATLLKDKSALGQDRFLGIMLDSFVRVRDKAPKEMDNLMSALRMGDEESRWFTSSELRTRFNVHSDESLKAYYTAKEVQDALFELTSRDAYRSLLKDGYKSVYASGKYTGHNVAAIAGDGAELIGKKVFSVADDSIIHIANEDVLEDLIRKGMTFGRSRSPVRMGDSQFNYLAMDSKAKVLSDTLTTHPIHYRPGHIQKFYEDGHYAVKIKSNLRNTVDGLPSPHVNVDNTVGLGRTKKEAMEIMENLQEAELRYLQENGLVAEKHGKSFEIITGEQYHTGRSVSEADWDNITKNMMSVNRARGEHVMGLDQLASIENPIESMARQIGSVMNRVTKPAWVNAQREVWVKTFANPLYKNIDEALTHSYPESVQDLVNSTHNLVSKYPELASVRKKAIQHMEYVEMINGMPSKMDEWYRVLMLQMAEKAGVGTKALPQLSETLSKGALAASKFKVEEVIRMSAFKLMISLNPVKQLSLQPSQMLMLSLIEPRYMFSLAKDGFARQFGDMVSFIGGKKVGATLDLKHSADLLEEFYHTGLLEAVGHHPYMNPGDFSKTILPYALEPTATASMKRLAAGTWKLPDLGFIGGESTNVMGHWLISRNRWVSSNPGKNPALKQNSQEIAIMTRELSLNPNPAGKMGYQDWGTAWGGVSAIMLQFFSHPHKQLMAMLPNKIGGLRVFTPTEKAKLAGFSFMAFGSAFVPYLNDYLDSALAEAEWDIDPDDYNLFKTGMINHMTNMALSYVTGEEQDVRFNTTYNPTGDLDRVFKNTYKFIMLDSAYKPTVFAGAGAMSKLFKSMSEVATVWNDPNELPTEKVLLSLERIANVSSGWSSYSRASAAYHSGRLLSRRGLDIGKITQLESIMVGLGITVGVEDDYYARMNKLNDAIYNDKDSETKIRQSAKDTLKNYLTIYAGKKPIDEILVDLNTDITLAAMPERQREVMMNEIANQTEKSLMQGEYNLYTKALDAAVSGGKNTLRSFSNDQTSSAPDELKNSVREALKGRE